MKNGKIVIGHVGTMHDHSSGKLDCIKKFPDIFEIAGIVEPDEKQRRATANIPSYDGIPFVAEEQLLNSGIDAVLIESHEKELIKAAMPYVENGVAVHIDKPAGDDVDTFRKLLFEAKKHNRLPVQLAYMYRYNPAVLDCKRRIAEGKLGNIMCVNAIMNTRHPAEKRAWLEQFAGGNMFYLGCHMVDLVYSLMGIPETVDTYLIRSGLDGTNAEDHCTAIFGYRTGASVVQATSTEVNGFGRRQLVVCGEKGTYEINPLERPIKVRTTELSYAETYYDKAVSVPIETVGGDSRYDDMMLDFAAMVRGEKENPFSYAYELELQKLVLAACGIKTDFKNEERI